MGVSTDANLYYGVEITDGDGDFLTNEPTGDWWTKRNETGDILEFPEEYHEDGYSFPEAFDNIPAGVPELAGIGIDWHCHISYPVYVLTVFHRVAWRGSPQYPNLEAMEQQRIAENWDGRLAAALKWLGIEPKVKPGWILASSSDH